MMLLILGALDIIIAIALVFSSFGPLSGNGIVMALGILWVIKGLFSILSSAASKFFFDVMGVLDLLAGIFLLLSFYGLSWHFMLYLGIIMLLKGLYSAGTDFMTTFLKY